MTKHNNTTASTAAAVTTTTTTTTTTAAAAAAQNPVKDLPEKICYGKLFDAWKNFNKGVLFANEYAEAYKTYGTKAGRYVAGFVGYDKLKNDAPLYIFTRKNTADENAAEPEWQYLRKSASRALTEDDFNTRDEWLTHKAMCEHVRLALAVIDADTGSKDAAPAVRKAYRDALTNAVVNLRRCFAVDKKINVNAALSFAFEKMAYRTVKLTKTTKRPALRDSDAIRLLVEDIVRAAINGKELETYKTVDKEAVKAYKQEVKEAAAKEKAAKAEKPAAEKAAKAEKPAAAKEKAAKAEKPAAEKKADKAAVVTAA